VSIFISYRRDGSEQVAQEIYRRLCTEYNIFLDKESLRSGLFPRQIINEIQSCSDFIFLVTDTVFDRCGEANDWIVREGGEALGGHKNIIPIFIGCDRFPGNAPDSLKELPDYNGIVWDGSDAVLEKIKYFLRSNKRLGLFALSDGADIRLDADSKQRLKELYIRFCSKGERLPVEVRLTVSDRHGVSELIKKVYAEHKNVQLSQANADMQQKKREQWWLRSLEAAIETLLLDTQLDGLAPQVWTRFDSRYPDGDDRYAIDENGIIRACWTYMLWVDLIEELLKMLVFDRLEYYNRAPLCKIDCFLRKKGKDILYFRALINPYDVNDKDQRLSAACMDTACANIYDISPKDQVERVYPEFYFMLGRLKTGDLPAFSYAELQEYPEIIDLSRYNMGWS